VVLYGLAAGHLKNPLDSEPHYDGSKKPDVRRIIRSISNGTNAIYNEEDFEKAFPEYAQALTANKHLFAMMRFIIKNASFWSSRMMSADSCRRLHYLRRSGRSRGVGSLTIFGYDPAVRVIPGGN